ncbi:hypothetical protein PybrP1_002616 [[Pythium] brassicae (nom. inval.)]|nr:hypothetical protein PybrP1_002616 [[Pythium] brassicae (nom. inval.)]
MASATFSPAYAGVSTPRDDAQRQRLAGLAPSSRVSPAAAHAIRLVVLLGMAGFVFGNVATWAPLYEINLINTFSSWWNGYPGQHHSASHNGVSHKIIDTGVGRNITITGHTEMVRPTFLFLFCILPFFVSVLALELLRHVAQARRLTSVAVWKFAMVLRRKPRLPLLGVSRLSWGEWIFGVVFVIGGNLLCFYYEWDRRIDMANAAVKARTGKLDTTKYFNIIGISSAYLCIYNMAFLLLPVTRNCTWMEFFNISYANGVKLHRWTGYATVITGVVHTGGYWGKWIRDGTFKKNQLPCFDCDLGDDSTGYYAWFNVAGFISVLAMVLMIPTSLPVVRRKVYEWFYISHWVLFIVSVFFAILHWAQIIWWILPSGLLFFISRGASSWNGMTPVVVSSFAVIGEDTADELVKVVFKRAAPGASPSAASYDFKVGNFVYLNVPHIAKIEWHALTIASSPCSSATDVTLLIKPLGDWSQKLVAYAKECKRDGVAPLMYMDGFYGASLELYDEYATLCLVGGGIGVTPLLSVLEDIAAKVASNGGKWTQRVVFILSFRELSLLQTIAPVLARLRELDPLSEHFQTRLYATRSPSETDLERAVVEPLHFDKNPQGMIGKSPAACTRAPRPFYEPLRSSTTLRVLLLVALFVVSIFTVAAARWGNGAIQGDNHPQLWMIERAFELAVFCASIVLVYLAIWYEFTLRSSQAISSDDAASFQQQHLHASALADIHLMRDLMHHLKVVVGERPDMRSLLQETLAVHEADTTGIASAFLPAVGVMVSGPNSLKMVTNEAIDALGTSKFDVHEEEFEL